jgi:type III restriction enzyme
VNVDTVHQCLLADFGIPPDQVAIETGPRKDLEGVDVLSVDCPVRYIITVQALREGWDCPFPYVLCSVADIGSPTYVEQILGRVMRLPRASRKPHPDLNVAYAFAASHRFMDAAEALTDALIQNGFEREEAKKLIVPAGAEQDDRTLFTELAGVFGPTGQATLPSERRIPFSVPVLAVRQGNLLEQLEETHFLDYAWDLRKCDPSLSAEEYSPASLRPQVGEIDIAENGRLTSRFIEQLQEDTRLFADQDWPLTTLVLWLDRTIPHPDISAEESGVFLRSVLVHLTEQRRIPLPDLVRDRYSLRRSVAVKIDQHRTQARRAASERLFADDSVTPVVVSPERCFTYPPDEYPAGVLDTRPHIWRKHYYDKAALLDSEEEFHCAQHIDELEEAESWVRNIAKRPSNAFWIQMHTDKFYPDFVCKLRGGRLLVVEYKGQRDWTTDDSKKKRDFGDLWEKRSKGRCLFIMVTDRKYENIDLKILGGTPQH